MQQGAQGAGGRVSLGLRGVSVEVHSSAGSAGIMPTRSDDGVERGQLLDGVQLGQRHQTVQPSGSNWRKSAWRDRSLVRVMTHDCLALPLAQKGIGQSDSGCQVGVEQPAADPPHLLDNWFWIPIERTACCACASHCECGRARDEEGWVV
jgi:hypothetical protein